MSGPAFLALYIAAFVLAGAGSALLLARRRDRWPTAPAVTAESGAPRAYLVAVLAGGPTRVVDTAVHALVADGRIRVGRDHQITRCGTPEPDRGDAVQHAVLDALADSRGARLSAVRAAGLPAAHQVADRARASGLLLAPRERAGAALAVLSPMLVVLCGGAARLAYELGTGGPAVQLLVALPLSVLVIAVTGANVPRVTPEGARLLESTRTSVAQDRAATARVLSAGGRADADDGDVLAAVALQGPAGIADADLRHALYGPLGTSSSGGTDGGSWWASSGDSTDSSHSSHSSHGGNDSGGHSHSCGGHGCGSSCGSSCGSG